MFEVCYVKYDYNVLLALKMDKDPFAAGAFGTVSYYIIYLLIVHLSIIYLSSTHITNTK